MPDYTPTTEEASALIKVGDNIFTLDPKFDRWLAEVKAQQDKATTERIITLLEAERCQMSHGNDYYSDPLSYAISLIKGENK